MNRKTLRETDTEQQQQERPGRSRPSGCLLRVYWMLLGNALVGLLAYVIAGGDGTLGPADLLYWLGVAGLVAARYVDIAYLAGETAEGEPATMKHWQRYSLGVLGVAVTLWLAVHGVGYFGH